jgi:tetratricopeptide (TPR) repeat protein
MTQRLDSRPLTSRRRRSWPRGIQLALITLLFVVLAYFGTRGKLEATRLAELDLILAVRDNLQAALDDERSMSGPLSGSAAKPDARSREVADWATQLEARIERFISSHEPASETEDLDLRLARATLAIAERRYSQASSVIENPGPQPERSEGRDRMAEVARVRADGFHDSGNPAAALDEYRKVVLRRPDDLAAAERIAECLQALRQVDQARDAYSELAKRLQSRGERRLKQLDPQSAEQDFGRATRIRAWLASRSRPG